MSTQVTVAVLPKCDIHNGQHDAEYDASIVYGNPPRRVWANVCAEAFKTFGGSLGTGRGQRLLTKKSCGHSWIGGLDDQPHCAEMACPNYINKHQS